MLSVLGREHGVLHRLVDGSEAHEVDIVGCDLVDIKVVPLLGGKGIGVALHAHHPLAKRLQVSHLG